MLIFQIASEPPPLPPTSTHPFANPAATSSRSGALNRATGRISAVNAFGRAGNQSSSMPPPLPPPNQALPPIPSQSPKIQQYSPSSPVHTRNASSSSSRRSVHSSTSPPGSPGPTISPRTSSLFTPAQIAAAEASADALDPPITLRSHSSQATSHSRAIRTPSRHLLQTALDLAQRAVEMDKNNDVLGSLAAYREAVARLRSVMERVGVEPNRDDTTTRRQSTGKGRDEGRTLRGIVNSFTENVF